ncbi:hypothetical protein ACRAWD_01260 [Caulobacter segnis]
MRVFRFQLGAAHGLVLALSASAALACDAPVSVCATDKASSLALIHAGRPAAVYVDAKADPAVRHAADSLRGDLTRVGGGEAGQAGGPFQGQRPRRDRRRAEATAR